MKFYIPLLGIIALFTVSCSTQLPARFYERPLKENAYIENYKDTYTVYLNSQSAIANPDDSVIGKPLNTFVERNAESRPFYKVVTGNDTTLLSNRHIYFKKADNFRDLGGIKTKDGKIVRWGMVYRSDNLSKLKEREFKKFSSLNIKTVYDLRTAGEITGNADNLPEDVAYVHLPIVKDTANVLASIRGQIIKGQITEEQSLEFMKELYSTIIADNSDQLRLMIYNIVQSESPVLYHCSAGKDRTGIVTALLFSILRVDRETIVNEYLLSDYYRREKLQGILKLAKAARVVRPKIEIGAIQNFMDVDERYLNEAFKVIDSKYGGMESYIRNQLQITDAQQQQIIEKFTY